MPDPAIENLRRHLTGLPTGPVQDIARLVDHLSPAWFALSGSDDEAMAPHKLARIEEPSWSPPP